MSSNEPEGSSQPNGEILEVGGGDPLPASSRGGAGGGRKRALLLGGSALGAVGVGAAAWGAWWYLSTGPQPAEALPADTLGYVALDLDPSGSQKIDALRTLKKFPAIEEELDLGGDVGDIDLKREVFEAIAEDADCDLDYAEDFEPWLGDRYAVAAVPLGGDDPDVVGVVQVTDGDAAQDAVAKLDDCDGAEQPTGTAVSGDWLLLAESDELARAAVQSAQEGTLADDETFRARMDEAGEPGVLSLYAGPSAGAYVLEELNGAEVTGEEVPEQALELFEEFTGAAATLRFDSGSLETEFAVNFGDLDQDVLATVEDPQAGELVGSLPASTMLAAGGDIGENWSDAMRAQLEAAGEDFDALVEDFEDQSGLTLPEDLEALLGDAAALAIDSDLDVQQFLSAAGPEDLSLPLGLKVRADSADVEPVLDKVRDLLGPQSDLLVSAAGEGTVAIGADEAYVDQLAGDGGLGEEKVFRDVLPEADKAASLFFLDLDDVVEVAVEGFGTFGSRSMDTGAEASPGDEEARENLEPLEALGMAAWMEDGVVRGTFRITTD